MKSVLISIQPKWCELIAKGKKTVEVRKTRPKIEMPFKCYIYCTLGHRRDWGDLISIDSPSQEFESYIGNGRVIGEFMCDKIMELPKQVNQPFWLTVETQITDKDYISYLGNKDGYGWHISDLVIYDKPKELSEFCTVDEKAVQNCICREQVGQPKYKTQHCGWIKGGFICNNTEDWCTKCKRKPITRPPQSWCYVEEVAT